MSEEAGRARNRVLGRGLSALLGEETEEYGPIDTARGSRSVPIGQIQPGRYQPRHSFPAEEMAALIESVREKGILQPLLVRRLTEQPDHYEIVAGERRWRAAQAAQLHDVPVIIREFTDREALEIALVENIQRQNLSPLEEAEGYQQLIAEFGHTQEALAKALGKSRSHVANTLRLLSLPEGVKELIGDGSLSAGHARALLGLSDAIEIAEEVVRRGLNVRQTESLVRRHQQRQATSRPRVTPTKDANTIALERDLSTLLGLKVTIDLRGTGGQLTIHYNTLEQLDEVLRRLKRPSGHESAAAH